MRGDKGRSAVSKGAVSKVTRRRFVAASVGAASVALASRGAAGTDPTEAPAAEASGLPQGRIGQLSISRLLLGGNLLTHFTHSRDLKYVYNLAKHYNTREKILETLLVAERHGVNTLVIHNVPDTMAILREHRRRGGEMQWITCTAHALASGDLLRFGREIEQLVELGADALYISGVEADHVCGFRKPIYGGEADVRVEQPRFDLLRAAMRLARSHGLPVGVGAHRLGVIEDCEREGIEADFYVKTFHRHDYPSVDLQHDSRWCSRPQEVAALMEGVDKPWIAFKVMAAGAIPPQKAFRHAFENGADFVLAGMFDFEIAEDVRIARQVLAHVRRTRPWRA